MIKSVILLSHKFFHAFSQILPYTDNMIEFGLDKKIIREVVFPKMTIYKMSDELINSIKAVIGNE